MASILLIEDDYLVRELLISTLTRVGHTVMPAVDGRQGLELLRVAPPDILITDIIMPGREGIETLLALRRDLPHLPIIAMSGGAANSGLYLEMAAKLGARHTLAKPFAPTELLQVVADTLNADREA